MASAPVWNPRGGHAVTQPGPIRFGGNWEHMQQPPADRFVGRRFLAEPRRPGQVEKLACCVLRFMDVAKMRQRCSAPGDHPDHYSFSTVRGLDGFSIVAPQE